MQRAAGEAAGRQVGIDCRQAEGQGFALFPHPGHEPAQLGHHGGAVSRHGKDGWPGHVAMSVQNGGATPIMWKAIEYSLYVLARGY
jgi:hypothetical protein